MKCMLPKEGNRGTCYKQIRFGKLTAVLFCHLTLSTLSHGWFLLGGEGPLRQRLNFGSAIPGDGDYFKRGSDLIWVGLGLDCKQKSDKSNCLVKTKVSVAIQRLDFEREFGHGLLVGVAFPIHELFDTADRPLSVKAQIPTESVFRVELDEFGTDETITFPIDIGLDVVNDRSARFVPSNKIFHKQGVILVPILSPLNQHVKIREGLATFVFYDTRQLAYRSVGGKAFFYPSRPCWKVIENGTIKSHTLKSSGCHSDTFLDEQHFWRRGSPAQVMLTLLKSCLAICRDDDGVGSNQHENDRGKEILGTQEEKTCENRCNPVIQLGISLDSK